MFTIIVVATAQDIQNRKSINKFNIPNELVIPSKSISRTFWNLLGSCGSSNGIKFIIPEIKLNRPSIIN